MAPDKIYLNKYMIRPGMLYPAQYPADTQEFEYIRKDALLEHIKQEQEELKLRDDYEEGRFDALVDVIEKIESL